MAQDTVAGEASLQVLMKVEKVDGRMTYYLVKDVEDHTKNLEIDEETYFSLGGN